MARLGRTFWRRLDGSVAAGFNFTQANVQTQWTFDSSVSFRSQKWLVGLDAHSLLTSREDADRQTRNELSFEAQRFIRPRWSYVGLAQFQQNEELSLNLRSLVGGGLVRVLEQSNRSLLQTHLGLAFTQEQYAGEGDLRIAELVNGLAWEWFTFDGRSTNLNLAAFTFIALESDSRFRLELNASFRSDIVGDLYWSINTFESFDSDPPGDRKRSDFGVSASLGWT